MRRHASHIQPRDFASYPLRAGNTIRPLIDGEPAFRRICQAVEAARRSVWVTVAWFRQTFLLPDGRGTLFDLLDGAVARGLDVRVIFWRPNEETTYAAEGATFAGTDADHRLLAARGSRFRARWDRGFGAFCQHQKSWLIDAGHETEIAFVGGINLNPRSMARPGHPGGGGIHDAYVEIEGPAATDVHHNFVQRWNEASDRNANDGTWGHGGNDELPFPATASIGRGSACVQIQRNLHGDLYRNAHPAPGAASYPVAGGERSIRQQYLDAIEAARQTIYIENQALSVEAIVVALKRALSRGVDVIMLLPAEPEKWFTAARLRPDWAVFFEQLASLGQFDGFAMCGIASLGSSDRREPIYVHAKLMIVDGEWATIGSCNLHSNSLEGHSEMNATVWDRDFAQDLRRGLFHEHLGIDTSLLEDREALALFRRIARENGRRLAAGLHDWQGLVFSLDPSRYGL